MKLEKIAKENKFRRRTNKKREHWGLNKKQRYFEEEGVEVKEGVVKKMGLYDAVLVPTYRATFSRQKTSKAYQSWSLSLTSISLTCYN